VACHPNNSEKGGALDVVGHAIILA